MGTERKMMRALRDLRTCVLISAFRADKNLNNRRLPGLTKMVMSGMTGTEAAKIAGRSVERTRQIIRSNYRYYWKWRCGVFNWSTERHICQMKMVVESNLNRELDKSETRWFSKCRHYHIIEGDRWGP